MQPTIAPSLLLLHLIVGRWGFICYCHFCQSLTLYILSVPIIFLYLCLYHFHMFVIFVCVCISLFVYLCLFRLCLSFLSIFVSFVCFPFLSLSFFNSALQFSSHFSDSLSPFLCCYTSMIGVIIHSIFSKQVGRKTSKCGEREARLVWSERKGLFL